MCVIPKMSNYCIKVVQNGINSACFEDKCAQNTRLTKLQMGISQIINNLTRFCLLAHRLATTFVL